MNCFYHFEIAAVGICKNCQKGLCVECAVDLENGLDCKNKCEDEVADVVSLIQKNKKAYERAANMGLQNAVWWGILAVVFLVGSINTRSDSVNPFSILTLVSFVVAALFLKAWFNAKNIDKNS